MKNKGRKCPECGGRCVNGLGASYASSVLFLCALVYVILCAKLNIGSRNFEIFTSIGGLVIAFVLSKLYTVFFGRLEKSVRTDV